MLPGEQAITIQPLAELRLVLDRKDLSVRWEGPFPGEPWWRAGAMPSTSYST
jgi:hypothetical protein